MRFLLVPLFITLFVALSLEVFAMTGPERDSLKARARAMSNLQVVFLKGVPELNIKKETNAYDWLKAVLNGDSYEDASSKLDTIEQKVISYNDKRELLKTAKTNLKNTDCTAIQNQVIASMCTLLKSRIR